jgi:hypothetical protein
MVESISPVGLSSFRLRFSITVDGSRPLLEEMMNFFACGVGQDRVAFMPETPQCAVVERDFLIHESSELRREFRGIVRRRRRTKWSIYRDR